MAPREIDDSEYDLEHSLATAKQRVETAKTEADKTLADRRVEIFGILLKSHIFDEIDRNTFLTQMDEIETRAREKLAALQQIYNEPTKNVAGKEESEVQGESPLQGLQKQITSAQKDLLLPQEMQTLVERIMTDAIRHYEAKAADYETAEQPTDSEDDMASEVEEGGTKKKTKKKTNHFTKLAQSIQDSLDNLKQEFQTLQQQTPAKCLKLNELHQAQVQVITIEQVLALKQKELAKNTKETKEEKKADVDAPLPQESLVTSSTPPRIGGSNLSIFAGLPESTFERGRRDKIAKNILVDEMQKTMNNYIKKFHDEKYKVPERLKNIQGKIMRVPVETNNFKEAIVAMQQIIEEKDDAPSLKAKEPSLKELSQSKKAAPSADKPKTEAELLVDCANEAVSWVPPVAKDASEYIKEYNTRMSQMISSSIKKMEEHIEDRKSEKLSRSYPQYEKAALLVLCYMKHDLAAFDLKATPPEKPKPSREKFEAAVEKLTKPRKRQRAKHLFDKEKGKLMSGTGKDLHDYIDNVRSKFVEGASYNSLNLTNK